MAEKVIIYVDLDDTLCAYNKAYESSVIQNPEILYPQSQKGFYQSLDPLKDAVSVFKWLCDQSNFDVYILSAPSLYNPLCYSEKRFWVEQRLGFEYVHRLIISYHKNLLKGDYLIDDRSEGRGQELFSGVLVQYGREQFKNWLDVKCYFANKAQR